MNRERGFKISENQKTTTTKKTVTINNLNINL